MTAPERVLYGLAYWQRHGDQAMMADLSAALSPAERAEAQGVLRLPGVLETLAALSDDELRGRMIALAGKS